MEKIDDLNKVIETLEDAERALKIARELSYTLDYIKEQTLSLANAINALPTLTGNQPTEN